MSLPDPPRETRDDHAEPSLDAMLDELPALSEAGDTEVDAHLGSIVERFAPEVVAAGVSARLGHLDGPDARALIRLAEATRDSGLLNVLARVLREQPDLPVETAWEALAALEQAGLLDHDAELRERWDELESMLEEDDAIGLLAEQLEGDAEGLWLALQGLEGVEPDVRAQIIAGLGDEDPGPGVLKFLRVLAHCPDPPTRAAALEALELADSDREDVRAVWMELAEARDLPDVTAAARRRIAPDASRALVVHRTAGNLAVPPGPPIARSFVTTIDGRGLGTIALLARGLEGWTTAAFACDVTTGIRGVMGDVAPSEAAARDEFDALLEAAGRPAVEGHNELALGLLAGCLSISGPGAPPALRYWLEATAGHGFQARPFRADSPGWDPRSVRFDETPERTRDLLDACPDWVDDSALTREMAEEVHLRHRAERSDHQRDAGAIRVLFERGLRARMETYRRMLLWMAWYWRAAGEPNRARSAMALHGQLSDPQHLVPGHPFALALATRSLDAALARRREPRK